MKSVFFGLGFDFDDGTDPGVAINEDGTVLEVHKNEAGWSLYARTGTIDQATVAWNDTGGDRKPYTTGSEPACAMNKHGDIVEVHKREVGDKLFTMYGKVNGTSISWGSSNSYDSDGHLPAVALTDGGRVVSVFQKGDEEVRYRVGRIDASKKTVSFKDQHKFGAGMNPKVAIDNNENVLAVWDITVGDLREMRYCVGKVNSDGETIAWGTVLTLPPKNGYKPAVALTNEGFVIVVYKPTGADLNQFTGTLDAANKDVTWHNTGVAPLLHYYDDGVDPVVAAAGNMAVTIQEGEALARLWYSTSIITDRANWMYDRLNQLGDRTLKELILPATHDAGMYTGGLSVVGKTQELSIYGQLAYGIRYFDLRLKYDAGDKRFDIHHNGVEGPTLATVLEQIAQFCGEKHNEVFILDFSHFEDFGKADESTVYKQFTKEVSDALGTWMYKEKPKDTRLADITLETYIKDGTSILVVVDENYPVDDPEAGFWVFRNSEDCKAVEGELRVFDQYAKDKNYEDVKKDQLAKYEAYDGECIPNKDCNPKPENCPCDLFLLSWTCTSPVGAGVWQVSKNVNRHLGDFMSTLAIPNTNGYIPNMLYVDYCEFARVTDVALFANGTPFVTSS